MTRFQSFVVTVVTVIFLASNAWAGFADSVGKSADRAGQTVERKTGQRSDGSKYKNYRFPDSKIRVQLPVSFKVSQKSKSGFHASSPEMGIDMNVKTAAVPKKEAGDSDFAKASKTARAQKNSGEIFYYTERKLNGVHGVETVTLKTKGDRNSARNYKWEGWDEIKGKNYVVTANFAPKKYDANKYEFDGVLNSLRWNFEETHDK